MHRSKTGTLREIPLTIVPVGEEYELEFGVIDYGTIDVRLLAKIDPSYTDRTPDEIAWERFNIEPRAGVEIPEDEEIEDAELEELFEDSLSFASRAVEEARKWAALEISNHKRALQLKDVLDTILDGWKALE
jgi:hypothetical protein